MALSEIGQRIRNARRQRGLSQAELAGSLFMSRATISAIENGTVAEVGARKLAALCLAVGLEIIARPIGARPTLRELQAEAFGETDRAT